MVKLYKNVSDDSKDAHNFYQSQVRIRVECSFGMLVHRWAILRRPFPVNMPLRKVTALTYCLCKLHNYCIDENELESYEQTKMDAFYCSITGSLTMVADGNGNALPKEILNGGEHSTDYNRRKVPSDNGPRERLLNMIVQKDLRRPSRK